MSDVKYWCIRGAYRFFTFYKNREIIGLENFPKKGPVVFVANHIKSKGPTNIVSTLPVRFHIWVKAEPVDYKTAPAYVRQDYLEKELNLPRILSYPLSYPIGLVTAAMMHGIDAISVNDSDGSIINTFIKTQNLLEQKKYVLIFPEDPSKDPVDVESGTKPFLSGMCTVGEVYKRRTDSILDYIPIGVHEKGILNIGQPIPYIGDHDVLCDQLENRVIELYHDLV